MAYVAGLCLLFAIDQWPVYHRLILPISALFDASIEVVAGFFLASLTTSVIPLFAMAILRPRRWETLGRYMLICGLLPLPTLLIPNSEGLPLLLAIAGLVGGMFWWFAYRRPALVPEREQLSAAVAWGMLALALVLIGGLAWQAHKDEQEQKAEQDQPVKGPQIWGGAARGPDVLLFDTDGNLTVRNRANWHSQSLPVHGVVAVKAADRVSAFILSASPLPEIFEPDGKIPAGAFTLSRFHAGKIESITPVSYATNDRPWALALRGATPLVVSDRAIQMFDPKAKEWHRLALSLPDGRRLLNGDPAVAVSNDGRTLYAGFNKGEWGGGMVAIDLTSGRVSPVEARKSAELCAGPLNGDCDPVTGVVPDPDHPQCVLASIGLSHMLMHGGIIRACPGRVDLVFEQALESPSGYTMRQILGLASLPRRIPGQTEAFFALVDGEQGSIWTVSPYALYRRETMGWSRHPMPKMVRHGDISSADGLSGVMLLSNWRNARFSLSGATPLAIPTK
jgi:hypothetical protein